MKKILLVFALLAGTLAAATSTVVKDSTTNDLKPVAGLTEAGFNLPSGATITTKSGSTLTVVAGTTVSGLPTGSGTVSGTNTGDQTSVTGNAGTATALQTARTINGTSFDGTANITVTADELLLGMTALGSPVLYQALPVSVVDCTTASALADGTLLVTAVYIPKQTTITGVCWKQSAQGVYTADNYNGVGLCSYSAGTITLVASSTDDGNIWKAAALALGQKQFSSTYNAAPGIYFIVALWNASSSSTAPSLEAGPAGVGFSTMLTNSAKLISTLASQTALPASQASSGLSQTVTRRWFGLY